MKHFPWMAVVLVSLSLNLSAGDRISIFIPGKCESRTAFGVSRLTETLSGLGFKVETREYSGKKSSNTDILVGIKTDPVFLKSACNAGLNPENSPGKEGFTLFSSGKHYVICGGDASGSLYACLELADRIKAAGKLPGKLNVTEGPEMVMRGTCIGLQKTEYLPGRTVYEYPYTRENFPWFYDKALWVKYLDMMVANRLNTLYLWNGHPFASLVKLKDYPYAVEVDEETFRLNEEIFRFLTTEADKRGIFVIQMFYNIIVSKPFAEKNGLKTQDRERPILPLIADYTRKSIAAFVEKYPNVGLLVTLGEAMNTIDDDVEWFTGTIIPGVKDGLKALGRTDEPPIVLRGHDTDAKRVMEKALPLYRNLYTMFKYNGESLTTWEPRDSWASIPHGLSELGSLHISNVHILANLEPFRYGSPDFIQKCVQAMQNIQGAKGLHLYPQASYWDWPWSADKTVPRLYEMERDWIWYAAWARYAWNAHRDRNAEITYWSERLGDYFGCGKKGKEIMTAYEESGQIAPKLLRRFGISDGNRQTLLLGMFMSQLVNPYKWNVYSNFYTSNGPEGEILIDYAAKEWKKEKHTGETPTQIIEEVTRHGKTAQEAILEAAPFVTRNTAEFERLKNDILCYKLFADSFSEKVKSALCILRYPYSKDLADLEKAVPFFEKSLENYSRLVDLTKNSYLYANSMQTGQRRIPISGNDGKNKTWAELYEHYRVELENYKKNLATMKSQGATNPTRGQVALLHPAPVKILTGGVSLFPLEKNQKIYADKDFTIADISPELTGLQAIRLSYDRQRAEPTVLRFSNEKPVKVLAGYFNGNSYSILSPPTLETNAQANERGQADIKIANALHIPGLYPVNIYSYHFDRGENELVLGKGLVLILGFIGGDHEIPIHDAGLTGGESLPPVDWMFY